MDHKKYIISLVTLISFSCSGCGYNPADVKSIQYEIFSGSQLDINYQRMDVINSLDSYNKLISSIPSMSDTPPTYDEKTETLIAIIAKAVNCSFYPKIKDVTRFNRPSYNDYQIIVDYISKKSSTQITGSCDGTPQVYYYYNFIKIQKTDDNITFAPRYNIF